MSDSQAYEELTVASDGVSVVKRFEEDEFPVPAIAFEFTSHRDEAVSVVLSDTVPEDIEVEDLGFHPEYGSEHWIIEDDNSIAFERDLDPEESYTTVYGIRATGSDNVEQFLTQPALDEVDPPLPDDEDPPEDIIPESDDDVVKEAISGDGEIPGLEDEEEGDDGEDVEKLDLKDPNDPEGGTTTASSEGGSSVTVDGETVVARMAAEIRQQQVSADDVRLLRKALEMAGDNDGSTSAKVDQIQDDIADLRAYTNALEEFLDENGTAQEILDGFEQQVSSFESQISNLQSSLEANSEQLESVTATVDGFDDDIQSLSTEIDSISEELDSVTDRVESVDEQVDTVTDDIETLSGDIDNVSSQVDTMDEEFDEFESAIDSVESEIDDLRENVSEVDVAKRMEEIEGEIEDLQTWQEQIKQTFGG
jgi:predicted  nucleic acid-binding Zn-ribbon protein